MLVSYKKITIDTVEAFKVLLLIPADVVLRAEGDSRVYVSTLGIEVGRVHGRRELGFPRWDQTFVKDGVPIANPGEKRMALDFFGSTGYDGSRFREFESPQTMELIRINKFLSGIVQISNLTPFLVKFSYFLRPNSIHLSYVSVEQPNVKRLLL